MNGEPNDILGVEGMRRPSRVMSGSMNLYARLERGSGKGGFFKGIRGQG